MDRFWKSEEPLLVTVVTGIKPTAILKNLGQQSITGRPKENIDLRKFILFYFGRAKHSERGVFKRSFEPKTQTNVSSSLPYWIQFKSANIY